MYQELILECGQEEDINQMILDAKSYEDTQGMARIQTVTSLNLKLSLDMGRTKKENQVE